MVKRDYYENKFELIHLKDDISLKSVTSESLFGSDLYFKTVN